MENIFKNPQTTLAGLKKMNLEVKRNIENSIKLLLEKNGGEIYIKPDSYHGYPHVYTEDAHCSIMEFKKAYIKKDGKREGRVFLETDLQSTPRVPHCENLAICELLQIWTLLIDYAIKQ